jgi:hypothetical protein
MNYEEDYNRGNRDDNRRNHVRETIPIHNPGSLPLRLRVKILLFRLPSTIHETDSGKHEDYLSEIS